MYKGAIIGFGKIARTNHVQAFNNYKLKDELKIIAVVEPNKVNLSKSIEEFPGLRFYSSIEKLFEKEKIDFVDIAAPPINHFEILKRCIKENVHIICEKPFTLSPEHAKIIRTMLVESGKVFIPCHQYKYSPIWCEFKNFIDSVDERSKVLLQFNVFRTEADPGLKQITDKWRTGLKETGGGILADTGVHYLYLSSWLFGKINKISSKLLNLGHDVFESEDTAMITLEGNKGISQITLTWAADRRFNSANIVCSHSSMIYTGGTNMIVNTHTGSYEISVPDMSNKINYTEMYISLFTDFFGAVKNNKPKQEWIEEAFQSVCLMNKCYLSSQEEKIIKACNEE